VSSDKQTVENQRYEIEKFAKNKDIVIDKWIEETVSGTKKVKDRLLGKLTHKMKADDLLLCTELSRLGRSMFMVMDVLNKCMTKNAKIWTVRDNYRLDDDISSKVLAFAFSLASEIERNLISQRTKEALARKKAEGVILGRPKGRKSSKVKLTGKEDVIIKLKQQGKSHTAIARRLKVNRCTLYRFISDNGIKVNYDN
jgi:DNA invertase Pin-like site-specific DNA recombinase